MCGMAYETAIGIVSCGWVYSTSMEVCRDVVVMIVGAGSGLTPCYQGDQLGSETTGSIGFNTASFLAHTHTATFKATGEPFLDTHVADTTSA